MHNKSCFLLILVSFSESVYNFTPRSTWLWFFLDFSNLLVLFHELLQSFNKLNVSMTTIWLYYNIIINLIGFQEKQIVCNDPVSLIVFQREELQFSSERSNRRFVRTKLGPPRWPFQDVLTLHDCRPQVFVELKQLETERYWITKSLFTKNTCIAGPK